jgi:hypothetical protein
MKKLFVLLIMPWHLLSWSDFQGKPPKQTGISAMSNTTLSWEFDEDDSNMVYNIRAVADFNPENSWTRVSDQYTLKHEQGHLDICQIVCNEATNYVRYRKYSKKEWTAIRSFYEDEWNELDFDYDSATNHSQNKAEQEMWNKWIYKKLQQ